MKDRGLGPSYGVHPRSSQLARLRHRRSLILTLRSHGHVRIHQELLAAWLILYAVDGSPEGYPRVATLKCSDRNFMQFRSFGYLHTRVVLSLQREIENLETQLDELDDFDASEHGDPHKLTCKGSDDEDTRPDCRENEVFQLLFEKTRPQILIQLKEKLMEYGRSLY